MTSRVVHISSVHPWNDERVYGRELGTLVRAGYDVHWIAVGPAGSGGGVTLHPLPRRSLPARLLASSALIRKATNIEAALYHIHDPELLPVGLAIGRRTGARIVYDKHEYQRGRRGLKAATIAAVERRLAPRVDAVVVVERDGSDQNDTDGLDLRDVDVAWVPNYPRVGDFRASQREADAPLRLVYSGVLARERGLWFMLDLVEELKARGHDVELSLVGVCHRERERSRFEIDLRRRGLTADVRRVGWTHAVPWADLMRESSRADVGLMLMDPAYRSWSNIPTKFYEYMALGLPFVCTDYPSWADFTVRHDCGVAVNPLDAPAVADAMLEVLNREWATGADASQFSWSGVEGNLVELYRRLGVDAAAR